MTDLKRIIIKQKRRNWINDLIILALSVLLLFCTIQRKRAERHALMEQESHIKTFKELIKTKEELLETTKNLNLCRDQVEFLDEFIAERRWR